MWPDRTGAQVQTSGGEQGTEPNRGSPYCPAAHAGRLCTRGSAPKGPLERRHPGQGPRRPSLALTLGGGQATLPGGRPAPSPRAARTVHPGRPPPPLRPRASLRASQTTVAQHQPQVAGHLEGTDRLRTGSLSRPLLWPGLVGSPSPKGCCLRGRGGSEEGPGRAGDSGSCPVRGDG